MRYQKINWQFIILRLRYHGCRQFLVKAFADRLMCKDWKWIGQCSYIIRTIEFWSIGLIKSNHETWTPTHSTIIKADPSRTPGTITKTD